MQRLSPPSLRANPWPEPLGDESTFHDMMFLWKFTIAEYVQIDLSQLAAASRFERGALYYEPSEIHWY